MKRAGVYRIHCKKNGKNYVGSSSRDWRNRKRNHMCLLKAGKHTSKRMQEDWDRYGSHEFLFINVCECDAEDSLSIEEATCKAFDARNPDKGYNTNPINGPRYRGGRPGVVDGIRFSRIMSPKTARAIASLLRLTEGQLVRLEQSVISGWAYGAEDGSNRVVGLVEPSMSSRNFSEWMNSNEEPESMVPHVSVEVARLKDENEALKKKVAEYEQMYA